MSFNAIQIILVFVFVFIVAIDQFDLLESLYQPIVTGAVIGLILGDVQTGLGVGGTYQLMTIGNMPVGGAQPPNAVIGGVMAAVFAIASGLEVEAAVGLAVPFALVGQYMVTLLFTAMSPMMSMADKMAEKADAKGIVRLNYIAMAILGLLFAVVCTIGLVGGAALKQRADDSDPEAIRRRLEIYEEKTSPLVNYYENKGVLRTETVSLAINRMGKDVANDIVRDIKGM